MSIEGHEGRGGAAEVADRRWALVRRYAADIARLEALDRSEGLDEGGRMELARLRINAERATTRAMLADDLADSIDEAERRRGAAGT